MQYLFTAEGEEALRGLPRGTLLAFDYDGTLAPIVPLPTQAHAPPEILQLLRLLAMRAPVAIVSGRGVADLIERVPDNVPFIVGNHGNEGLGDEPRHAADAHALMAEWTAQLRELLGPHPEREGLLLENKGISMSVHYRLAGDPDKMQRTLPARLQRLDPAPVIIGGKLVFNLLPPGSRTKYEAIVEVAARCQAPTVLFVGDDVTDEYVFERAPASWLTLRVESSPASRARYFVRQQDEVARVLAMLVEQTGTA
ncbi:MAG TPA: trehalose-phosphatase [Burkholderiaceae bacterium]|nr:trehalose-phosphatase [Burkholderiaceae bacterium]